MQNQNLELLSIGDASEYLGISIDTLRRWEKRGRIEPLRSPGGHRYFKKSDLDNLFGKRYTRDEDAVPSTNKQTENQNLSTDTANAEQSGKDAAPTAVEKTLDNQPVSPTPTPPAHETSTSSINVPFENQAAVATNTVSTDEQPVDEIPHQSITITTNQAASQMFSTPPPPPTIMSQSAPQTGLPSWRSIREEIVEEKIEISQNVSQPVNKTQNKSEVTTPVQSNQESKGIPIPQIDQIRVVVQEEEIIEEKPRERPSASEAYINQQKASILTPIKFEPDEAKTEVQEKPSEEKQATVSAQEPQKVKVSKKRMDPSTKKAIAITLFILGLMLASFAWYSLWKNSQVILSPIAN